MMKVYEELRNRSEAVRHQTHGVVYRCGSMALYQNLCPDKAVVTMIPALRGLPA